MRNIDPLIRREFERIGINIVENDSLADLVISKVKLQRIKRVIGAGISVLLVISLLMLFFRSGSANVNNGTSSSGNSLSYSQDSTNRNVLPLPQAGYRDVNGASKSGSVVAYIFELKQGWIIEEITDNPDPIMGDAGTIKIFKMDYSPPRLVQQYQMSSGTQINEFGVPQNGIYKFVFTFNNPNFRGRVRFAFVRSR